MSAERGSDHHRLSPADLRWICDPRRFSFETTADLGECPITIIGQPRAMDALKLGFELRSDGYNIFVAGEVGTGRSTAVRRIIAEAGPEEPVPQDLVFVHNFEDPDRPRLLTFPPGEGCRFREAMSDLVERLQSGLLEIFESEAYREKRAAVVESFKERHKAQLRKFEELVQQEGFALVQVQLGPLVRPGLMPVVAGNPVDMDQLEKLTQEGKFKADDFEALKEKQAQLSVKLEGLQRALQTVQRELTERLSELDGDVARPLAQHAVGELRERYDIEQVRSFLDAVEQDIHGRLDEFRQLADAGSNDGGEQERASLRELTLPYTVNVLVDNTKTEGRPVVWETSPSFRNLFGVVEKTQDRTSQWRTDHTRIKAGSLLRANGGCLVADALDVLVEPGVWPALKRTLRTRRLEVRSFDPLNLFSGVALSPEPVPVDVKVVLIGTKQIYRLLYALDEDFKKIFKVKAEFALETALSDDELVNYACFVHKKCGDESLPPFYRNAVAAVVEYGVRLAGRKHKLTTRFKEVADVIREAGYWAREAGVERVEVEHVDRALLGRRRRVDMLEELLRERIADGQLIVDLDGRKVGQVNGLAVLDIGDHVFGQPSRITAVTAMGRAGIIDVERESLMSGSIHTKGVLILSGFLRERFAQKKPLALSASICFEQHYGLIDGDSASSAELFALLSSLSEVPLKQGIAVTGSVNQRGEMQPIGGVNQKIEGFFDLCKIKGLDGEQGVLIPARNVDELMLRKEVVRAVDEDNFHIWGVSTVEEGIQVLTDLPAGARDANGEWTPGSVFARADAKLAELAEGLRAYTMPGSEDQP